MDLANPLIEPFNLHLLFDPYIAPNIGSTRLTALNNFTQAVNNFFSNNLEFEHKPLLELLNRSCDVEITIAYIIETVTNLNNEIKEKVLQFENPSTNEADKQTLEESITASFNKHIQTLSQFMKSQHRLSARSIGNYTDELDDILTNMNFRKQPAIEYMRMVISKFVEIVLVNNFDELIIPGGYSNKQKHTGHLVGLYYNLTSATFVVANSGEGVDKHNHKDNSYEIILFKSDVDQYTIIQALTENYLARGVFDPSYTIEKYYTAVLNSVFKGNYTSDTNNDIANDLFYHEPQLSGSCTFFGIYYILYYLYNSWKMLDHFNRLIEYTKSQTVDVMINYISKKDQKITSNDKNYLDMLYLVKGKDNRDEELNKLYDKYVSDTEKYTQYDTSPNVLSTDHKFTIDLRSNSEKTDYKIYSVEEIVQLGDLNIILMKLIDMIKEMNSAFPGWRYISDLYTILKILTTVYKKENFFVDMDNKLVGFIETVQKFFEILDKKFKDANNVDSSKSFYKVDYIRLILLNIVIKVNSNIKNKFFTQLEFNSTDNILDWMKRMYGTITSIFDVSMYDLAQNMKNYQHYIPSFSRDDRLEDWYSFDDEFIEAWANLVSKIVKSDDKPEAFDLIRSNIASVSTSLLFTTLKDQGPILNFFYVVSDVFYEKIFNNIFLRIFNYDHSNSTALDLSYYRVNRIQEPDKTIYKISMHRNRLNWQYQYYNAHNNPQRLATNFYNDINFAEAVNYSHVTEINELLERFTVEEDERIRKNMDKNVDENYQLVGVKDFSLKLYEFDQSDYNKSYRYNKCLLTDIKPDDLNKFSPKILSVILLFDLMCNKKFVTEFIMKKLKEVIMQVEKQHRESSINATRIELLKYNGQATFEDMQKADEQEYELLKILIRLKIIHTLATDTEEHFRDISNSMYKLCASKRRGYYENEFANTEEAVFYRQFILNYPSKLKAIIMYEIESSSYSKLFSELLKSRDVLIKDVSDIHLDKLFGKMIDYTVVGSTGDNIYKISLIKRSRFKNFTYNTTQTETNSNLSELYYFYLDHRDNKIHGISSDKTMPAVEIIVSSDQSSFTVIKKDTVFEKVSKIHDFDTTIIKGITAQIFTKLSNITNSRQIIWWDKKSEIVQIYLLDYNITFEIRQNDKSVYFNNYKIVTNSANFCWNRWISDLSNAFLLVKDNQYKILLLDNYETSLKVADREKRFEVRQLLSSIWINSTEETKSSYISIVQGELNRPNYHLIDFHYTGLYLIFSSEESFRSYVYYCARYSKTNCLLILHNQYIQYYLNNNTQNSDYLANLFANTPFKYYFLYKLMKQITSMTKFDVYGDYYDNYVARQRYYPSRYIINRIGLQERVKLKGAISYEPKYSKPLKVIQDSLLEEKQFNGDSSLEKSISSIDTKYSTYLKAFVEDYKNCTLKDSDINTNKMQKLKDKFNEHIKTTLLHCATLFEKVSNEHNFISFIYHTSTELYNLMEYVKMLRIVESIATICASRLTCECQEIRRLRDILDTSVVYTGERQIQTVLFEILFGSFIRRDQYRLYSDILNNFKTNSYKIYQMLMGEGKTSVLAPLLIFTYIVSGEFPNIISVMPEHLINQSFDALVNNYSVAMDSCNIVKLKVDREDNNKISSYFSNSPDIIQVLIVDDGSFKSIKLNEVEFGPVLTDVIKNKSIAIVDEIDSIMDPLSSELNYPLDYVKISQIVSFLLIYYVRQILTKLSFKKVSFSSQKETQNIIDTVFRENLENKNLDFSSELKYFVSRYVDKQTTITSSSFGKLNFSIVGIIRKVYNTLINALLMIYNKDYGFGRVINKYEKNHMIAIPYKAVNDPVDKSEYTDSELTICLTIFTYYYHGLRAQDLVNIVGFVNKFMQKYKYEYLLNIFLKDLKDILKKYDFELVDLTQNNNKREEFLNSVEKLKFNYDLIDFYLKVYVIPKYVELTDTQLNCSFIDAITSQFCKYKIAFSGTVNILLPKLESYDHEFQSVVDSNKANGSIISAITGFINPNRLTYVNKSSSLDSIFEIILKNGYNVVVDVGAFFKDYTAKEFVTQLAQYAKDRRKYVFVDESDKKLVYEQGKIYKFPETIYASEELFIYYDNKHIVGVDIKQPYHLKVIVTVSRTDTLTKVGQGIFRARNTNFGHLIDFFVDVSVKINDKLLDTTVDLLRFLYIKEREHVENSLNSYLLQNIKYLIRYMNPVRSSYVDKVPREEIIKEEDLTKNLYAEYVRNQYCNTKNTMIAELCDTLHKRLDKQIDVQSNNIQQQKELSTVTEVVVETTLEKASYVKKIGKKFEFDPAVLKDFKGIISNYLNINGDLVDRALNSTLGKQLPSLQYLKNHHRIYVSFVLLEDLLRYKKDLDDLDFYNYNYYYIKQLGKEKGEDIKYLLITPMEFFSLFMYLNSGSSSSSSKKYNIIIKHKLGHIKYQEEGIVDITDTNELFVQMLLAKKLKYRDYMQIFDVVVKDKSFNEFKQLVIDMENMYNYKLLDEIFVNFLLEHRERYRDELLKLCAEDNIDQLLKVLDVNLDVKTLTSAEKQLIIRQNELTNNDLVNCQKQTQTQKVLAGGSSRRYKLIVT